MDNPSTYYQDQLNTYTAEAAILYKKLTLLSTLRLLIFIGLVIGIYFTYSTWELAVPIALLGISLFILMLTKHANIREKRKLTLALADINKTELEIGKGNFHDRIDGSIYQDPNHPYSLDIDLYGRGSFFQNINRTATQEGTDKLAEVLQANDLTDIPKRQAAIKELSDLPEWRQLYSATASLIEVETSAESIIDWLQDYKPFLPKAIQWLPYVFWIGTALVFFLFLAQIAGVGALVLWLVLGGAITGAYLKKINNLAFHTDKIRGTFKQYSLLLDQIEKQKFSSELLQQKQATIKSETQEASVIFKKFSSALDALDNRNNLISAIFGNGYFLLDLRNSYRVEQWLKTYKNKVNDWFEIVTFFDAYNSLGNYAFNHPQYTYPTISDSHNIVKATSLGHPLLNPAKRIDNDITIANEEFYIITGANMAGKSTFLRTVSLHIVMANVGLPVCAASSTYNPIKLITSMRTSDSLTDDSSYFFSELTRLKLIVDTIQDEPYFIILDEILKGTNSTDKAIGSRKFVEKLVASSATGIIATHDLSLCEISEELHQVKNYYFDAEIINDELYFDYKFKKGICKNMNASFLLKKMEII